MPKSQSDLNGEVFIEGLIPILGAIANLESVELYSRGNLANRV